MINNVFYRHGRAAKPGDICVGAWTEQATGLKVAATVAVVRVLHESKNMVDFVYITGQPSSIPNHFCTCDAGELIHIDDLFQESTIKGWTKT